MTGILYFLAFQLLGMLIGFCLLKRENICFSLLIGSVIGSVSLQWFPVLPSFFMGFCKNSHIVALILMAAVSAAVYMMTRNAETASRQRFSFQPKKVICENPVLLLLVPIMVYVVYVLHTHTLFMKDGAMHTGQCTYGDMNMHLGFITSIANQKTFPPEYSILPGTKLSYPFLSDSISSSLYVFGTSLKLSYLVPMYVALLQVFFGMYTLSKMLLKKKGKAFLAFILFFLNGGFGFYYFITEGLGSENFTRIFTAFYETPTNLIGENIRFTNIIVDMLIPQRATLFGFAVLFPLLCLITKAKNGKENKHYFILAGLIAGLLPMIHTHSFMALGILCFGWLLLELLEWRRPDNGNGKSEKTVEKKPNYFLRIIIVGGVLFLLTALSIIQQSKFYTMDSSVIFAFGIIFIAALFGCFVFLLIKRMSAGFVSELLGRWGIFLLIVLVLALPQLLFWTFGQASGEGFIRGGFNWCNEADNYFWFYFKNLGITFILLIAGLIFAKREKICMVLPAFMIWGVAEFIIFQPNPYDNNKLLLVAFLFICIFTADFAVDMLARLKKPAVKYIGMGLVIFLGTISALLTMGREAVSDYELYSADYLAAAEWVEQNTQAVNTTILTANNHNNAIAALTGRNIVCGSGSFLYYHGLNYGEAESDVAVMYQDSGRRDELLEKYDVKYIVLGPNEIGNYAIGDMSSFETAYKKVFSSGQVSIYKTGVPER